MVTVSVVTPTYERTERLRRAIESVRDQSFREWEHIVVDDGSEQADTAAIVAEYGDRVYCLEHDRNRGAAAARNTGIDAAAGEYVAFLDSDDYWHPAKLARQVRAIDRDPETVGVYCDADRERGNRLVELLSGYLADRGSGESDSSGDNSLLERLIYPNAGVALGSTLLVERDALEAIGGFDESFPRYEEIDLALRLLEAGQISRVPDQLAVIGASGYPDATAVQAANERFVAMLRERYSETDLDVERAIASHQFLLARCFFRDGQFRRGLATLSTGRPHDRTQYLRLAYALALGTKRYLPGGVAHS